MAVEIDPRTVVLSEGKWWLEGKGGLLKEVDVALVKRNVFENLLGKASGFSAQDFVYEIERRVKGGEYMDFRDIYDDLVDEWVLAKERH